MDRFIPTNKICSLPSESVPAFSVAFWWMRAKPTGFVAPPGEVKETLRECRKFFSAAYMRRVETHETRQIDISCLRPHTSGGKLFTSMALFKSFGSIKKAPRKLSAYVVSLRCRFSAKLRLNKFSLKIAFQQLGNQVRTREFPAFVVPSVMVSFSEEELINK